MSSTGGSGNFHILALVGGIAIIAMLLPVFSTGGSPFVQSAELQLLWAKITVQGNGTITADSSNDTLTFVAGDGMTITQFADTDTIMFNSTGAPGSGEANTASNLGSGTGVFAQKVLEDLEFKSLSSSGDGIVISSDANHVIFSLNNVPKSEIALTGSWVASELPADVVYEAATQTLTSKTIDADLNTIQDIDDNEIKASANIAWSKISKTSSSVHDMADVGVGPCQNNEVLKYSTGSSTFTCQPDATGGGSENTSAVNVGSGVGVFDTEVGDQLQFNSLIGGDGIDVTDTTQDLTIDVDNTVIRTTSNVGALADVASGCANGEILKYQTSNSTWICAPDAGGSGVTSINGDTTAAQVFSGTSGNMTITDTGAGTLQFDIGSNVVITSGSQTLTDKTLDGGSNTFTNIPKSGISTSGSFAWSEVSKSGSILNDIGAPTSSYGVNSQRLTGLGTPTTSTDVQRVDKVGLQSVVLGPCPDGSPLEFQTSNSTWICGIDAAGGVSDGDKGDITVSSGGTVWDIDAGVIGDNELGTGIDVSQFADGSVTNSEFQFINTVTSNVQTQLNSKLENINSQNLADLADVSPGCANGEVRKYQTSNSTWICAADTDTGEVNTASNSGHGDGNVVLTKSGSNLPFRGIAAGTNIVVTQNATDVIITSTGGSGITSLNGDSASSQTISGTSNQLTVTDSGVGSLTLNVGTDIVQIDQANSYTDGNMQTFTDDDFRFSDSAGDHYYVFSLADLAANRVVSLPLLGADDTFVFASATQTLTGKTIDGGSNTFTNIPKSGISTSGSFAWNEVSKSGSLLSDLGDVSPGCADGEIRKYQTSNSTWICATDNAGGISDGDKGDITVSASGTVWDIDTGVVGNNELGTGIDVSQFADGSVSDTEFQYINSVTSNVQTQLGTKLENINSENFADLADVSPGCANGDVRKYQTSNSTWICATDTDTGEVNTASNSGHGDGNLVLTKSGSNLPFRGIAAGTNIAVSQNSTDVIITSTYSAITSLNGDTNTSQTISGTTNQLTVTDTGVGTLSLNVGTDVVQTDQANSYVDGNMQTFTDDDFRFSDSAGDHYYLFSLADLAANRVVSMPLLGADDTFVFASATQTLTGKTIDGGSNTLTNIAKSSISTSGSFAWNEVSKSGSLFSDLGDVSPGCANGDVRKYQTSNSTWICATDNSGGVSDGDKGDITVSASGATWTIDDNVVTYAKMQDVSATSRILGRITAGAGDTEELTGAQATTLLGQFSSTLQGVVPASGGGTTNFLRADGTWTSPGGSSNTISQDNSDATVTDAGTGTFDVTLDGTLEYTFSGTGVDMKNNGFTNAAINCDGTGNTCTNVDTGDFIGVAEPRLAVLTAGGATLQATNTPSKATIDGTNMDYVVLDFDTTTAETAVWNFEVPDNFESSANVNARIRFQVASGTQGVCWDGSWLGRTDAETVDAAFGTSATGCDTSTGTNQVEVVTLTWTSAQHGLAAGDTVFFKLFRDVSAGQDQNSNDARLIDVRVTWS